MAKKRVVSPEIAKVKRNNLIAKDLKPKDPIRVFTCQEIIDKRREIWEKDNSIEKDKQFREATANAMLDVAKGYIMRQEVASNPEYMIEMFFMVVDKNKKTMPFFLSDVQQDLINKINQVQQDYKVGKCHFMGFLVLKGRQQGLTSFITAYQLACTLTKKNFEGFTAADEEGNASAIFQNKAKFIYDNLPEIIKPTEKFNNRKQFLFSKLNSSWEVRTASSQMGRSRTINFFHGSEAAFWKALISDVQASMGESMTKDSIQILESTANGFNEYRDLWVSGKWINCFYEWWRTAEYSTPFINDEECEEFIQAIRRGNKWIHERCVWLLDTIELTPQQVHWYYNKYDKYIDGNTIKQEYPCSPDEAFLASGACIFDADKIATYKVELEMRYKSKPYEVGFFDIEWDDPINMLKPVSYKLMPMDDPSPKDNITNRIRVYQRPISGHPYVIGGDTKGEGSDRFTATVIDNHTGKRVATLFAPNVDSKIYTSQVWALAKWYNDALVSIEINFNTLPIELLVMWGYHRQYQREIVDNFTGALKKAYGWRTDGNTRPLIIERQQVLVRERLQDIVDIPTLDEMLTFVKDKTGRPDAESGKHDDLLISDMIAEAARTQQGREIQIEIIQDKEFPDMDFEDYIDKDIQSFFD